MTKRFEDTTFSDDYIFCRVLTSYPDICRHLIEMILGRQVGNIVGADEQKRIQITGGSKGVRLDVYFSDDESHIYDIELQNRHYEDIPQRTRYYQDLIDQDDLIPGGDYDQLKESYVIFICNSFDQFKQGRHLYHFEYLCTEDPAIHLGDGTHRIFLCSEGTMDDVSPETIEFLRYLKGGSSDDPFVKSIDTAVSEVHENETWRREYEMIAIHDRDKIKEGIEIGQKAGKEQARTDLILTMLKNGMSPEDISKNCELPLSDVLNIQYKETTTV